MSDRATCYPAMIADSYPLRDKYAGRCDLFQVSRGLKSSKLHEISANSSARLYIHGSDDYSAPQQNGRVAEWLKAPVLKTGDAKAF